MFLTVSENSKRAKDAIGDKLHVRTGNVLSFRSCASGDNFPKFSPRINMSESTGNLDEMEQQNYSMSSTNMDPKNNEELIIYVS